jgi:IS1 family transposase
MNKLSTEKQCAVINALVEGNSIRGTSRLTGVDKNTVMTLLAKAGSACKSYQDKTLRNLSSKLIQCDEIWSFCYAKEKNIPRRFHGMQGIGDVWTWTALDADTKLIAHWHIGSRSAADATIFIKGLAPRLANRVQLTTDGHKAYIRAVEKAFRGDIDFSQLVKLYGSTVGPEGKYSPGECVGIREDIIQGKPKSKNISTSFVERQNLTMRMGMRRFTRLTNAFSKKIANLEHAVALHFMHYNFCRIHQTLRSTPAMRSGLTNKVWEIADSVKLLETV